MRIFSLRGWQVLISWGGDYYRLPLGRLKCKASKHGTRTQSFVPGGLTVKQSHAGVAFSGKTYIHSTSLLRFFLGELLLPGSEFQDAKG